MTFVISKILSIPFEPSTFIVLLGLLGIVLLCFRRRTVGLALLILSTLILVAIRFFPLDYWVLSPLEDRFPSLALSAGQLPAHIDGIIVLGGVVDPVATKAQGTPALDMDAERVIAPVPLLRRYPAAKLVFTGGSGSISDPSHYEADAARELFTELGLDVSRIVFEGRSRTTWDNAVFSKALVMPKPGEVWLLVTSARHMPRSVGIFRKVGWPVVPYPVAFKASPGPIERGLSARLLDLDAAAHEWAGLVAYHLMGRTSAWFPSP